MVQRTSESDPQNVSGMTNEPAVVSDSLRRRKAIRTYGWRIMNAFLLGLLSLNLVFLLAAFTRQWLVGAMGQTVFVYVFAASAFASLIVPQVLYLRRSAENRLLYCPGCNNFLGRWRAVYVLNQEAKCHSCGRPIEIAPVNQADAQRDLRYLLAGLFTVVIAMSVVMFTVKAYVA